LERIDFNRKPPIPLKRGLASYKGRSEKRRQFLATRGYDAPETADASSTPPSENPHADFSKNVPRAGRGNTDETVLAAHSLEVRLALHEHVGGYTADYGSNLHASAIGPVA
jgi:hypothetical protein